MEIEGQVYFVNATETVGVKDFRKRLIVIETIETYPQKIPVEFTQDRVDMLDYYKVGDKVKVSINLRGSEYQGKFYLNANGWKISKDIVAVTTTSEMPKAQDAFAENEEDLPF